MALFFLTLKQISQPDTVSPESAYNSRNVILSGFSKKQREIPELWKKVSLKERILTAPSE